MDLPRLASWVVLKGTAMKVQRLIYRYTNFQVAFSCNHDSSMISFYFHDMVNIYRVMVVLTLMFCQAIMYFITIVEVCKKKNLVQVNHRRKKSKL